ncbi:sulfatase-like hydrolase/transferase [Pikeienuella sp. HZG-20]|uniref:sulfatase-like hydrolase/transferase n=1 Tax=Paludibacillus litoralis TaxID=3133267 RepID=UPI0030EF99F9
MARARNILFIMFDQLRWDYLSCYGHPHLKTPNLDRLAARGVRFTRCYVQSPVCGASRMSTYTGRYVHSHGASYNNYPLKVGEETLGDHLRKIGVECWLVGKTHMKADAEGMRRLGLAPDSVIGARVADCGFDAFVREDGLIGEGPAGLYDEKPSPYNEYLNAKGYGGRNPWHDFANSGVTPEGEIASGWLTKNAGLPTHIHEEDSETPWLTDRAIEFMKARQGGAPWVCHLSYIKPHWPYIAPAPYNAMYGPEHVAPPIRDERERQNPHPIYGAFMSNQIGRTFSREGVRETVIPAYMGLIKQCDDQMGRLFAWMEQTGAMEETMIVATSDHGDYLGDHWLGEKDLFHEQSVKVPLIIHDPSPEADRTRGAVCEELVEQIDLAATFIDHYRAAVPDHVLEGRSLTPFLRGETPEWRDFAVSEYDYSISPMAGALGVAPRDARLFMIADKRWKFIHAEGGFRPMLFDMETDPEEYRDLGDDPEHADIISMMYERLARWARRLSQRTTMSEAAIAAGRGKTAEKGILIGVHDGDELPARYQDAYRGPARPLPDRA